MEYVEFYMVKEFGVTFDTHAEARAFCDVAEVPYYDHVQGPMFQTDDGAVWDTQDEAENACRMHREQEARKAYYREMSTNS